MMSLRHLFAILSVALLLLTGQQITMARAHGPGVVQAVLCSGGGFVTVMLDADGIPVGPPHICPDATLAFVPDVVLPAPQVRRIAVSSLQSAPLTVAQSTFRAPLVPPARGPPPPV